MTTPIERPNGTDSGKNLLAQILLLLTGMAVHTLGIALITRADLGTTPISTLPLTLSAVMGVTLGTSTFIINIALFLSQIVMLGSRFERRQWLQLPSVLLFSAMIDAWMAVLSRVPVEGAVACWSASLLANVVIAAGILLQLRSSLILQPIDGAVLAASIVTGRAFPTIKIANDVGCVIAAAAVGLVFLGNLYGIGAGTLVSAFAVGLLIKRLKARAHARRTALRTCPSGPACFKGSTKRRPASRM